jgi:hypothetical protein
MTVRVMQLARNQLQYTPADRGLEELFSAVLEKFLQPINAPWAYGT